MKCQIDALPDYGIIGNIEIVYLCFDSRDGYQISRPALAGCLNCPRHYIQSKDLSIALDGFGWDNVAIVRGIRDIPVHNQIHSWLVSVITVERRGYTLGIFSEEDCRYILEQIPEDKRVFCDSRNKVATGDVDYINSIVIPLNGRNV